MLRKILGIIKREELIKAGELVVAGVSGGADSICLLSVLLELKEQLKIQVAAVHVHHGIRGTEADGDERFVRSFCEKRNVPLLVYRRDVPRLAKEQGISEEEAGRRARYECFKKALLEYSGDKVAVAHNQNDNAETVLFHLFRGSGLKGLSGMDYQAPMPFSGEQEEKKLVRPLLDTSREDIEKYLLRQGILYCRDSTNDMEEYSRNRIRKSILPQACRINGEAVSNILRAAKILGETEQWMGGQAEAWIREQVLFTEENIQIPAKPLGKLEPVFSGCVLRKILEKYEAGLKDITKRHTDSILQLAQAQTGKQITLPGGLIARRGYGYLILDCGEGQGGRRQSKDPGLHSDEEGCILHPSLEWREEKLFGRRFRYRLFKWGPGEKILENRYTKWFTYDRIKDNLSLRGRRPGDWFQAYADGRKQTVKDYMVNEKIPSGRRGQIPLLAEGSHVLWIVDGRISEAYKVTEESEWILEICVSCGWD